MRRSGGVGLAGLLLVALGSPGGPQEATDLKPVIAKVLEAHGGEARLRQLTAFTEKAKARSLVTRSGSELTSTVEVFVQLPDRQREVTSSVRPSFPGGATGQSTTISVYNGDQSWKKTTPATTPGKSETITSNKLTRMEVAARQDALKFSGPRRLLRLTDPASELSWLGEVKVGDCAAVGIQLAFKMGPAEKWFLEETGSERAKVVRLTRAHEEKWFFDKETGLLIKTERTVVSTTGMKFVIETLYSDYKKIDGIMIALKETVKSNGAASGGREVVEFKVVDKLEDRLFQQP
jgi:hypothetical protein